MMYYIQDSRSYTGNCVMWWAKGGGYTSDVSSAEVFTEEKAKAQEATRESDRPWPKGYIDGIAKPRVDMQYMRKKEAETFLRLQRDSDPTHCAFLGNLVNGTLKLIQVPAGQSLDFDPGPGATRRWLHPHLVGGWHLIDFVLIKDLEKVAWHTVQSYMKEKP